jgi:hypothetical protein
VTLARPKNIVATAAFSWNFVGLQVLMLLSFG